MCRRLLWNSKLIGLTRNSKSALQQECNKTSMKKCLASLAWNEITNNVDVNNSFLSHYKIAHKCKKTMWMATRKYNFNRKKIKKNKWNEVDFHNARQFFNIVFLTITFPMSIFTSRYFRLMFRTRWGFVWIWQFVIFQIGQKYFVWYINEYLSSLQCYTC